MQSYDVAGYHLRGFIEGLRALRIDVEKLIDDCAIDRAQLADPEVRFPDTTVGLLWLTAEQRYGKASFGFDLALCIPFGKLELIDYLVASCPTLGTGIECLVHHARLSASGVTFAIQDHMHERESGRRIVADHVHAIGALPLSMSEYTWTLLLSRFRRACGAAFKPVLWLRARPSVAPSELLEVLGSIPEVAEEEAMFIADAQWNLDNPRRDPLLHRLMRAQDGAARLPQSDFLGSLQAAIASAMHRGDPNIGRVATRLGFTPRTLQRRLEDDGLTFQQVLEDLRKAMACQYLTGSQLSLSEISALLAYTDTTAFGRAFRRWTDRAPSDYRKHPNGQPVAARAQPMAAED